MGITANSGPFISYGISLTSSGGVSEYNEQRGPSLVDLGDGLLDPRSPYCYQPGQGASSPTMGFWGLQGIVDFIPTTISSNNIASQQTPVVGTPVTLNTASSGIGVLGTFNAPEGGTVSNLLYIDSPCGGSSNAGQQFGQTGSIQIWNPASVCGRGVTINTCTGANGGSWTIAGRDVYGYKVTESIAASSVMNSKKAYKYISSVLPCTTLVSTGVLVGTQDLYGFPIRADSIGYVTIWWGASSNATLVSLSTGAHVFAVTTPASNTTGDVRGTFSASAASNSTGAAPVRLQMFVTPSVANLQTITSTNAAGLFGVAQFSSV